MKNISECNCYRLFNKNEFMGIKKIKVKDTDCFIVPVSFDENKIIDNLNKLNTAINDKSNIHTKLFDVRYINEFSYEEWNNLIKIAEKYDIGFLVNLYEEYSSQDMKTYIEKYTRIENNKKELIFNHDLHLISNNILLKNENDTEIVSFDEKIQNFLLIGELNRNNLKSKVKKHLTNNTIYIKLKYDEILDKNIEEKLKILIDYLTVNYNKNKVDISFLVDNRYFTSNEFNKLLNIENYIRNTYNNSYELKFNDFNSTYNKNQILNANKKIKEIVNDVKEKKLSPYEKIIYLHKLISEIPYKEFYKNDDLSRNIYSILNTQNIVCVGYSMLFSAILLELNDENIKSKNELVEVTELHSINCVYLKDEKYDIEGYYNLDITFGVESDYLNYFMIPVTDFYHMYKNCAKYVYKTTSIQNSGNLGNDALKFKLYNENYLIEELDELIKNGVSPREIIKNTLKFLDTNLGNKYKPDNNKITSIFDHINKCVNESDVIDVATTAKALYTVANLCYGMNREESKKYAEQIIYKTLFNTLFECEREKCINDFAKKSLEIEKGLITLNRTNKKIR